MWILLLENTIVLGNCTNCGKVQNVLIHILQITGQDMLLPVSYLIILFNESVPCTSANITETLNPVLQNDV